ncbi:MAG: phosphate signaling complex protein PhoU [Clostridiales bacterium]|jgi:phosphate transport system protein|nr:phosphate signaling complex protein PhoU [Clostridiales bacterium]
MRRRFDEQLLELNQEMIAMGSRIEQAIENAGELMASRDVAAARIIMQGDQEIDRMEREIEGRCLRLLLMQQPVASDLRLISSALKMITDMERIGDQSSDIAEIITMPVEGNLLPFPSQLQQMSRETANMVRRAVDAYVTRDIELARAVVASDDVVDNLFDEVKRELIKLMNDQCNAQRHADGMQLLDMLMIAKYYERSADHATNIAEWVEYAVTGKYKGEMLQ